MRTRIAGLDVAVLVFCFFSLLVAGTVELWWLRHGAEIPAMAAAGHLLARAFRLYGQADPSYYHVAPLARLFEGSNVFFTQPLLVWVVASIFAWRPQRRLMLAVGSFLTYSVLLYYVEVVMRVGWPHGLPAALFWGTNAPWLVGGGLLMVAGWRGAGAG